MSRKTSPKTRGTNFERRIRKVLEEIGWDVFRSAGSRTCADLIALKATKQILAVQCKASQKPSLSDSEWEGLIHLQLIGARSLVVCRDSVNHSLQIYELVTFQNEAGEADEHGLQMRIDWP